MENMVDKSSTIKQIKDRITQLEKLLKEKRAKSFRRGDEVQVEFPSGHAFEHRSGEFFKILEVGKNNKYTIEFDGKEYEIDRDKIVRKRSE